MTLNDWSKLNSRISVFSEKLSLELKTTQEQNAFFATLIEQQILEIDKESLIIFRDSMLIDLRDRIIELDNHEKFMNFANGVQDSLGLSVPLTRSQVICQLYTAFVYLGESCFSSFKSTALPGSMLKKCCKVLTDYPIRGVRNAVAHANWGYLPNGKIQFHYLKGDSSKPEDQVKETTVFTQDELEFWTRLAKVVAYVIFQTIRDAKVR